MFSKRRKEQACLVVLDGHGQSIPSKNRMKYGAPHRSWFPDFQSNIHANNLFDMTTYFRKTAVGGKSVP